MTQAEPVGELLTWTVDPRLAEDVMRFARGVRRLPPARQWVLYRFFDRTGSLLYIGITGTGIKRWHEHSTLQPWWPEVASVTVRHYPTLRSVAAAELAAIRAEGPRYNVAGVPK